MKRLLLLTILLSGLLISQPAFSQIFADFEDGTTQGFGKYWGGALTTFQWAPLIGTGVPGGAGSWMTEDDWYGETGCIFQ